MAIHEGNLLGRFDHPNLIRLYEVITHSPFTVLSLEYFEGRTLSELIEKTRLSWIEAIRIGLEICNGLAELHARGWVHRDLKPKNILVAKQGDVKLIDFAFASPAREFKSFAGTIHYASPEQIGILSLPVDHSSDLYSLGVLLYEMFSGSVPFPEKDPALFLSKLNHSTAPELKTGDPTFPKEISGVVTKLLSKDPDDRIQSAREVFEALQPLAKTPTKLILTKPSLIVRHYEFEYLVQRLKTRSSFSVPSSRVLIAGDPGSGKSFLLQQVCKSLSENFSHIFLYDSPLKSELQFLGLRKMLSQWIRKAMDPGSPWMASLQGALRGLESILSSAVPEIRLLQANDALPLAADLNLASSEVFRTAFLEFLRRLAKGSARVVIAIENLASFDPDSLGVIEQFLSTTPIETSAVVFIATVDSSALTESLHFTQTFDLRVQCEPVDLGGVQIFVRDLLGVHRELPAAAMHLLSQKGRGNLGLTHLIAEHLLSQGILYAGESKWTLQEQELGQIALPDSLRGWLVQQARLLPSRFQPTLEAAAHIGLLFETDTLVEVLRHLSGEKQNKDFVQEALTTAVRFHILEQTKAGFVFSQEEIRRHFFEKSDPNYRLDLQFALANVLALRRAQSSEEGISEEHWILEANSWNASRSRWGAVQDEPRKELIASAFDANYGASRRLSQRGDRSLAWEFYKIALDISAVYPWISPSATFYSLGGDLAYLLLNGERAVVLHKKAIEIEPQPFEKSILYSKLSLDYHTTFDKSVKLQAAQMAFQVIGESIPKYSRFTFWFSKLQLRLGIWMKKPLGPSGTEPDERLNALLVAANQLRMMLSELGHFETAYMITARLYRKAASLRSEKGLTFFPMSILTTAFVGDRISTHTLVRVLKQTLSSEPNPVNRATFSALLSHALVLVDRVEEGIALYLDLLKNQLQWYPDPIHWFTALMSIWTNCLARKSVKELQTVIQTARTVIFPLYSRVYRDQEYSLLEAVEDCFLNVDMAIAAILGDEKETARLAKERESYFSTRMDYGGIYWNFCGAVAFAYMAIGASDEVIDSLSDNYWNSNITRIGSFDTKLILIPLLHLRLNQFLAANGLKRKETLKKLNKALGWFKSFTLNSAEECHISYVHAVLQFHANRRLVSLFFLKRAKRLASEVQNHWILCESYLFESRIFEVRDKERAREAAQSALFIAMEQEWKATIRSIKSEFHRVLPGYLLVSTGHGGTGASLSHQSASVGSTKKTLLSQRNLDILLRLSLAARDLFTPEKQMELALRETLNLLAADRVLLFLPSSESEEIVPALELTDQGVLSRKPSVFSRQVVKQVVSSQSPVVFTGDEGGALSLSESIISDRIRSIIAVPLSLHGKIMGILYCDSKLAKGIFAEEDASLLSVIGSSVVLALESSRVATMEIQKLLLEKDLEIARKLKVAYGELEKKNLEMKAIFSTIRQGICTLNSHGKIVGEYSEFLEEICHDKNLEGKSVVDLIFSRSQLSKDAIALLQSVIEVSFENTLAFGFQLNANSLPREILLQAKEETESSTPTVLEAEWTPIAKEEEVQSLMLTVRDVTRVRALEKEAESRRRDLELIGHLIRMDQRQLLFFQNSLELLKPNQPAEALARNLHTVKGLARMFELGKIANEVHEAEDLIARSRARGARFEEDPLFKTKLDRLLMLLNRYVYLLDTTLRKFSASAVQRPKERKGEWVEGGASLQPILDSLPSLCSELNRRPCQFELIGDSFFVSNAILLDWVGGLNHLVRNSLDHGFSEDGLGALPKLVLACEKTNGFAVFVYEDNGRGIQEAALLKRARSLGRFTQGAPSWEDLTQLIFEAGVSSREVASAVSGRGEGMGAFKATIEGWGGSLQVLSRPGEGFRMRFSIPIASGISFGTPESR